MLTNSAHSASLMTRLNMHTILQLQCLSAALLQRLRGFNLLDVLSAPSQVIRSKMLSSVKALGKSLQCRCTCFWIQMHLRDS